MIPFKKYTGLPMAASGWNGPYNSSQAGAFMLARGGTFAVKLPPRSRRYQIFSFEKAIRVWDDQGKWIHHKISHKLIGLVGARLPANTVVEVYFNGTDVIVSDIMMFHNLDVRELSFQERMASWWYMPQEFRSMDFFNESNFSRLNEEHFYGDLTKVLFKPDFVRYPLRSNVKVHNWLSMRKPVDVDAVSRNVSQPTTRRNNQ